MNVDKYIERARKKRARAQKDPATRPRLRVRSRHGLAKLERKQPPLTLVDVTSRGPEPWVRFSPFYPHGGIPVPFSPGRTGASVEGIWQGLKVFESEDVDPARMDITTMRGLKRTVRKYGRCLGHREGLAGEQLLGYLEARQRIYVPTYNWVLDNLLQDEIAQLVELVEREPVTLLDYETNCNVEDLSRPLSHAGLVMAYVKRRLEMPG